MPLRLNHHDNGMSWSLCMCEQRENEESQKRKSHVTFGTAAATKVVFGMFSLIALVSNITIPKHQTDKSPVDISPPSQHNQMN